jgi:hypothetical protein
MLFAVDIDGTIATWEKGQKTLIGYMNRELGLDLPPSRLTSFTRYRAFEESPEVQEWLAQSDERRTLYQQVHYQSQFEPEIQETSIPLPGAVASLYQLADLGRILYVTLRKPLSEQLTRTWLASYEFPSPSSVCCCEHYQHKYLAAYQQAEEGEYVMLIDDNAPSLIARFKPFFDEYRDAANSLRKRLAVVAYGAKEPPAWPFQKPAKPFFDIVVLPSWTGPAFRSLCTQIQEALPRELAHKRL